MKDISDIVGKIVEIKVRQDDSHFMWLLTEPVAVDDKLIYNWSFAVNFPFIFNNKLDELWGKRPVILQKNSMFDMVNQILKKGDQICNLLILHMYNKTKGSTYFHFDDVKPPIFEGFLAIVMLQRLDI